MAFTTKEKRKFNFLVLVLLVVAVGMTVYFFMQSA